MVLRLLVSHTGTDPAEAASRSVAEAARHNRIQRSRLEMIREYAETQSCRAQFLLGYLGEQLEELCGHCDNCLRGTATAQQGGSEYPPHTRVEHAEWGPGIVLRTDGDRLAVHFDQVGYKTLSVQVVQDNQLLIAQPVDRE